MMQWFDGGEAVLTALGKEYNYTLECEWGRKRLWKISQHWYQPDLDQTILLKTTWRETCDQAQAQAEAWEEGYGRICATDTSRRGRMLMAARNTRRTRTRLARSAQTERES